MKKEQQGKRLGCMPGWTHLLSLTVVLISHGWAALAQQQSPVDDPTPLTGQVAWEATRSPLEFPPVPQFYSPCVFRDEDHFRMWTTAGDRIRYYESLDGRVWQGGSTVFYASEEWELDGNAFEGYLGGISDPRVLKGATPGHPYTLYYTAGPAPNNELRGGIGVAFSQDGLTWTRYEGNPVLRYPGGYAFVSQAYIRDGRVYLYFLGGGSQAEIRPPDPRLAVLEGGVTPVEETVLNHQAYPLAYDPKNGSWQA